MSTERPLLPRHIQALEAYVPGKPISETEREFGISGIAKLASNENCFGMSPHAKQAIVNAAADAHLYPDAGGYFARAAIAEFHNIDPKLLTLGNGTNELITLLVRTLVDVKANEAVVYAWPSFVCYRIAAHAHGARTIEVPCHADDTFNLDALASAACTPGVKLVFLPNPNNPTGAAFSAAAFDAFLKRIPSDVVVVLDEAYAEYVRDPSTPRGLDIVGTRPRTVVLRTFSKVYGLAGLRIGYAVSDMSTADALNRVRDAFNTTNVAQAAAVAAMADRHHVERSVAHNTQALPELAGALQDRGFAVTPSQGNFVMARVTAAMGIDVPALNLALLKRGLIVRPLPNYGLQDAVRITIGTDGENERLLSALDDILQKPLLQRAAVLAIDGPAGAGKSTVAKRVAEESQLVLVDTGAIYRSVALLALRHGVSVDDEPALAQLASRLTQQLHFEMRDGVNTVHIGEEDVSLAIRDNAVSVNASAVARHPAVRAELMALQRSFASRGRGAVLEGRDIGTVVFPDAKLKAFVTASPSERAQRRYKELQARGQAADFAQVYGEILARDQQDTERPIAPLRIAADAVVVDTTEKSLDEVVVELLTLIASKL